MSLARFLGCSLLLLATIAPGVLAQEKTTADQNYLVVHWGPNEGFPGNSATDLAQTREGFIWAGTFLSGLVRFDGVRFTAYSPRNTPQFSGVGVKRLMTDRSGMLWISTFSEDLLTWDQLNGFALILTNVGRMDALIWSQPGHAVFLNSSSQICELLKTPEGWRKRLFDLPGPKPIQLLPCTDQSGQVWWLQNQNEIGVWRDGQFAIIHSPPGLGDQRLTALTSDAQGNVWVGTDRSLMRWENRHLVNAFATNDTPLNVSLLASAGSSLWVEHDGRLRRIVNGQWAAEAKGWSETGSKYKLRNARGDSKGGFWASHPEIGLLHVLPDGTLHQITVKDGLPSDGISRIFIDHEDAAWISYERGGLVQVRPRLFKAISRAQGLKESLVNSVCEDSNGVVWIGTAGNICSRYQEGRCVNYSLPPDSTLTHDTLLTVDAGNQVWAGGRGCGLLLFTNEQFAPFFGKEQFPGGIRQLLPAGDGKLWVGSFNTISLVEGNRLKRVYQSEGDGRPCGLGQTSDGTIWAGVFGGYLMQWNGTHFIPIADSAYKSQSMGRYCSLCPAPDGGMWIGTTEGGLLYYKDGRLLRISTLNGLHSDRIAQVQLDQRGNLWLATDSGIERLEASALEHFKKGDIEFLPVSQYGPNDGIENIAGSIEFQPNCWRGSGGRLYFAMGSTIAYVNSDRVKAYSLPPTAAIEEICLDQRPIWPDASGNVVTSNEMERDWHSPGKIPKIKIPPGHYDLEFRFTGLSHSGSRLLQFKYQLEGEGRDWRRSGAERVVHYNHLPPGKYTFRVKAGNSDDVWGESSAAIQVELLPFFYQTAWFQWFTGIGIVSGSIFAGWNVSRRRAQQHLKHLARQHEIERDRIRIARDMHDEIGSKLARILYISELAKEGNGSSPEVTSQINAIAETSRDVLQSLDEIVWAVNPRNDTLPKMAVYLSQYANDYFQPTDVNCAVRIPINMPEHPISSEIRHNLFLAFKESLTNVLKHAAAKTVAIQMEVQPTAFEIVITDDGRGFSHRADLRTGQASTEASGLLNMQHRLTEIGGTWVIADATGKGTRVRLTIPLKPIAPENNL